MILCHSPKCRVTHADGRVEYRDYYPLRPDIYLPVQVSVEDYELYKRNKS